MKTKIIYISGSEVFDAADIRAAFNEVRLTLGLASDTVLFGVPVDSDDAGLVANSEPVAPIANVTAQDTNPVDCDIEQEIQILDETEEVKPVKKSRKSTKLKSEPTPEDNIDTDDQIAIDSTPVTQSEIIEEKVVETQTPEKVIPILSILSGKKDTVIEPEAVIEESDADTVIESEPEDNTAETEDIEIQSVAAPNDDISEPVTQSVRIESVSVEHVSIDSDSDGETITTQSVTIEEMMTDEIPEADEEKTLERLLEKMTPLREDIVGEPEYIEPVTEIITESKPLDETVIEEIENETGIDATLEQLATEFVEKQDQIDVSPRTETTGKIGKLKNILPFKKAKREEPGLMGDLFGWAGIAANDDDFSIPGFFTTSASKK